MSTLCLISARNLGDAVLHADFLRRLQRAGRADHWIVWTFPQARFLFEGLPDTDIVCSDFPMGATGRAFVKKGGWRSFLTVVRQLRAACIDDAVDLVGDLRERVSLRMLGATRRHSPEWAADHPFRHHIRPWPFRAGRPMTVPASLLNLYDAQLLMLQTLSPGASTELVLPPRAPLRTGQSLSIGLHPSASAPFKLWPVERWSALVTLLCRSFPGSHFTLFGSPAERAGLETLAQALTDLNSPPELFTASLPEFKQRLGEMDLLFGLDSFSVHLAHSMGVPSVVLVGANDPRIFTPPSGTAVTHPGRCPVQPCGGRPSCVGTTHQYSCMVDISSQSAMNAIPLSGAGDAVLSPFPVIAK